MNIRTLTAAALAVTALGAGASSASAAGTLAIGDAQPVTEGAAGTVVNATFPILYHRNFGEVPAYGSEIAIVAGTATEDVDFEGGGGADGVSGITPCGNAGGCSEVSTFNVKVIGDDVDEPDETVSVTLSSNNVQVTDGKGVAVIRDDDEPAPAPKDEPKNTTPETTPAPTGGFDPGALPQGATPTTATTTTTTATATTTTPAVDQTGDETGPRMGMVFRGLRKGKAKVRVSCPVDEQRCVGRLAVRLNGTTFGSKAFRLQGGASRLLRVSLSRKERRALRNAGVVYLRSSAFDATGNRLVRDLSFQL